jgi:hypothetical protein
MTHARFYSKEYAKLRESHRHIIYKHLRMRMEMGGGARRVWLPAWSGAHSPGMVEQYTLADAWHTPDQHIMPVTLPVAADAITGRLALWLAVRHISGQFRRGSGTLEECL